MYPHKPLDVQRFLERVLMPTINAMPHESAHNMAKVCQAVLHHLSDFSNTSASTSNPQVCTPLSSLDLKGLYLYFTAIPVSV